MRDRRLIWKSIVIGIQVPRGATHYSIVLGLNSNISFSWYKLKKSGVLQMWFHASLYADAGNDGWVNSGIRLEDNDAIYEIIDV